jgi:hypothetical protein
MTTIAVSEFVRRQTPDSEFSHFEGTEKQLLDLVDANWNKAVKAYRDGVITVPVPPKGFFSSVIQLEPGDRLEGVWEPRQNGEEPRRKMWAIRGQKTPAARVDIVLYRHDVLAEGNERSSTADWEIISINACPTNEQMPMSVGTLMANHFQMSGGTATQMSDSEFVKALKVAVEYWKDKAMIGPSRINELEKENALLKRRIGDVETLLFSQN